MAILQVHNEDRPLADIDLSALATQTEGWNGADLALLSNQAALEAIRRFRSQGHEDPSTLQISAEDFAHAFELLAAQKNRV